MPDPIKCHVTKSEQIALTRALAKVECRGRAERERKAEAFEELRLDWVRKVLEQPAQDRVSSSEMQAFYDRVQEAGAEPAVAMARVMENVQAIVMSDPFVGRREGADDVALAPALLSWVLEKLDKAEPCGADDLAIAAVEARLRLAERGAYVPPAAAANHVDAPSA